MAKPEWGTKRTCQSCGARFYDLGRSPAACPACGAIFDVEALSRARRPRPPVRTAAVASPVETDDSDVIETETDAEELEEAAEVEEEEEIVEAEEAAEEEEEGLIEDASELGEDEDMSDVIESDISEEPR